MGDALVEATAGSIGSVIAVVATFPLAQVATWQSIDHRTNREKDTGNPLLPSPIRELVKYSRERGWRSFFAGMSTCAWATAMSGLVYYGFYGRLRYAYVRRQAAIAGHEPPTAAQSRSADIGVLGSLLVSSLAGSGNVILTNPVWTVTTRLQANQSNPDKKKQSAMQVSSEIWHSDGWRGFFRGLVPALLLVVNPVSQFVFYEQLMSLLVRWREKRTGDAKTSRRLSTADIFMLMAAAKTLSTLITYPMLTIKQRLQAAHRGTDPAARYHGVFHAITRILGREGFRGFYKGLKAKLVQTVLAAALLMTIKERVYQTTHKLLAMAALTSVGFAAAGKKARR